MRVKKTANLRKRGRKHAFPPPPKNERRTVRATAASDTEWKNLNTRMWDEAGCGPQDFLRRYAHGEFEIIWRKK